MIDLSVGTMAFLVALLPMAAIAAAVRIRLGRPVLYRVNRPGLGGRLFTLYKVRTMINAVEVNGRTLSDRERITPLGRVLRRLSLDELPQLFNVLRGEMSLVGPRPLHPEYLEAYTAQQARRHNVKPGITGLAQISGCNAISWKDRLALDVYYVDHVSLALDLRILARTLIAVLRRQDVSADGDLDVPRFTADDRSSGLSDPRSRQAE